MDNLLDMNGGVTTTVHLNKTSTGATSETTFDTSSVLNEESNSGKFYISTHLMKIRNFLSVEPLVTNGILSTDA